MEAFDRFVILTHGKTPNKDCINAIAKVEGLPRAQTRGKSNKPTKMVIFTEAFARNAVILYASVFQRLRVHYATCWWSKLVADL